MNNAQITKAFFAVIDAATRNDILESIAKHYGISTADAMAEVIDDDAEHLLDYLTGNVRTATSLLMKRHGLN